MYVNIYIYIYIYIYYILYICISTFPYFYIRTHVHSKDTLEPDT